MEQIALFALPKSLNDDHLSDSDPDPDEPNDSQDTDHVAFTPENCEMYLSPSIVIHRDREKGVEAFIFRRRLEKLCW